MSDFSIVIPALNEEEGIGRVIDAIRAMNPTCDVVVVDDGSTDNTADVARSHGARVVRHPMNCGYGKSLKDGIANAHHDIIVITDADGTYPIDRIPDLLAEYDKGFDMVVGARQGAAYRGTFFKMPARFFFKKLVEFTTGRYIPDINSGLRVFSKKTAQEYFVDICNGFSFTTTITLIYMLTGKMVAYLPIAYHKRVGRSKVKMIRDSFRTLQYITECIVRYNPLKLFLMLAVVCLIIGAFGMLISPVFMFFGCSFAVAVFGMGCIAESIRTRR